MKPPRFAYHDPEFLDDALDLLAFFGDESKVLAGGQSLMPLLNLRLARPEHLIDINRIDSLRGVSLEDSKVTIGALTRHAEIERSELIAEQVPLLSQAMPFIGHDAIRNRGTIGGSIAHADPSAELPAVMTALNAVFTVQSNQGTRKIPASDFFLMPLTTAMESEEMLTSIEFELPGVTTGTAVEELARRRGDFALVGVAATVALDDLDRIATARVVTFGTGATPVRHEQTEQLISGASLTAELLAEVRSCAADEVTPTADRHGSLEYRKSVTGILVDRAVKRAHGRAQKSIERNGAK